MLLNAYEIYGNAGGNILHVDHTTALTVEAIIAHLPNIGFSATALATHALSDEEARAGIPAEKPPARGFTGCINSRTCGATASAWRKLIRRWFGGNRTGRE